MVKNRILVAACALVCSAACVTQGTYDTLKAEHDKNIADFSKRDREHQETEAKLKAEVAELTKQLEALQAEHAATLKERTNLESSVAEMTTALSELQKRRRDAEARLSEFRALVDRFKGLISAGKLKVKIVKGRMVVSLATDVLFAAGSANLSKDGQGAIGEVAGLLVTIPDREFQVEGHTDNTPIRTAQYRSNWELGAARALTVVRTMIDSGMPPERVSASTFAETKPASDNTTTEGRAANRRIEITVVPDLSTLPGFDELNRMQGS